jgi:hypothetical protein
MAKNAWAVKLGRLGGKARAAALDPARRSEIAKKAIAKRWGKTKFARVDGLLVPHFTEKGGFLAWVRGAKRGDQAVYFTGELASFRQTAANRIVELERLSDGARPSQPRPAGEAVEIDMLRAQMELAASVSGLASSRLLHLTQKRNRKGEGWHYIATRTGAR